MTGMIKLLVGGAGFAALAAAAPSSAQYYGNQYGYANPYGYGVQYGVNTSAAAQQCTAAVQNRLYSRGGLAGVLGSLVGAYGTTPRVLSVTQAMPTRYGVRVRGLASSGRTHRGYGAYGVGAYGGLGYDYNQMADLSFRCDVDYRGYVRNVDINRRY